MVKMHCNRVLSIVLVFKVIMGMAEGLKLNNIKKGSFEMRDRVGT